MQKRVRFLLLSAVVIGTVAFGTVPLKAETPSPRQTAEEDLSEEKTASEEFYLKSSSYNRDDQSEDFNGKSNIKDSEPSMEEEQTGYTPFRKILYVVILGISMIVCYLLGFFTGPVISKLIQKKFQKTSADHHGIDQNYKENSDLDLNMIRKIAEEKEKKKLSVQKSVECSENIKIANDDFCNLQTECGENKENKDDNYKNLYYNRKIASQVRKQMNGFNLDNRCIMEQLKLKEPEIQYVYLQRSYEKKPLFLLDDKEKIWINPIWVTNGRAEQPELSSIWYDTSLIQYVFEIQNDSGEKVSYLSSERTEIKMIEPACVRMNGNQANVIKKGIIQI